nr:MAG TPA: hypothetical protein [Caudoviricetes sp.]
MINLHYLAIGGGMLSVVKKFIPNQLCKLNIIIQQNTIR